MWQQILCGSEPQDLFCFSSHLIHSLLTCKCRAQWGLRSPSFPYVSHTHKHTLHTHTCKLTHVVWPCGFDFKRVCGLSSAQKRLSIWHGFGKRKEGYKWKRARERGGKMLTWPGSLRQESASCHDPWRTCRVQEPAKNGFTYLPVLQKRK